MCEVSTATQPCSARWVHSEAQLGNALTKGGAKELEPFYRGGQQWKTVSDEQMQSARKRRQNGQ